MSLIPRFCLIISAIPFVMGATDLRAAQDLRGPWAPAAAQEDFDVLQRALEEAHGGYTRFVAGPELAQRLAAHRARLDRPIGQLELAGVLSAAIAELRDGHARLELDSVTSAALVAARVIPLRLAMEGPRLVVQFNDSPTDSVLHPGMEIVSINGRAASAIVGTLWPKVSGDGFIETGKRHRIGRQFPQLYWLHVERGDTYTVDARAPDGRMVRATLAGIGERDRRASTNPVNAVLAAHVARLEAPPGNVALQFLEGEEIARLRVRAFDGDAFPATLDSAFRALRERGTSALILDLRGNGGGVDEYGALLVSYFTNRPFRYFDHIKVTTIAPSFATWLPRTFDAMRAGTVRDPNGGFLITPSRHPGVGEQQPAANGFPGKLLVLIDGGSFSTTTDVAAHLRSWNRAVFIGEETAGTYEGNTSGLNARIVLPHSGLRLRVMMYGYWNAVEPQAGGRGVIPEHVVPFRVTDLLAGRDPVMELARSLAR